MKRRHLLLLGAMALWLAGATGCRTLYYPEPDNAGHLRRYMDLEHGGGPFQKIAYGPVERLAGKRKLVVMPLDTGLDVRIEWFMNAGRVERELARAITAAGTALREELAQEFVVLQDRSFADRETIIVTAMVTDLAAVRLPGTPDTGWRRWFPPTPRAAIEIAVRLPGEEEPLIRIKDWRAGRQKVRSRVSDGTPFGDLRTIFHYWGQNLADIMGQEARRDPETVRDDERPGFLHLPDDDFD